MLKIAIYIPTLSGGGSERFATVLAKGLVELGFHVFICTGPKSNDEYHLDDRVKRVIIHKKYNFVKNIIELYKYLNNNIDICICLGIYPNLVGAAANFYSLSTKIVLSERNAPKEDNLSWKSKLLRFLLYNKADAFVFQTPEARLFYNKSIQKKGVIIPNPLKENLPERGKTTSKKIVAVGRLMPQKNHELLLNAFADICSWNDEYSLHIYGEGLLKDTLINKAKELGISDRVHFEGFVHDVHNVIKNSDIYVMTSDFEGLPNSLMEAMAMGFPVISTDCPVGGPRMLINNDKNGILIPIKDKDSLVDALKKYICNTQYKEELGHEARISLKDYELPRIMNKWTDFINSLMS